MVFRTPKYNPRRVNTYVPNMGYHSGVVHAAPYEVVFGPMAVAAAANILNAQSVNGAGSTSTFLQDNTDPIQAANQVQFPYGPGFGRCLSVVLSGAGAIAVSIKGRDYLGQPVFETVTTNGATPVITNKAFKYVDTITWANGGAVTMNVGTSSKLGLPFRAMNVLAEMFGKQRVATLGTLGNASTTDPQTATSTGDPRGTYTPQSTLDGVTALSAVFLLDHSNNANGNGGLHGLQHYTQ
jgi:hypothetical protein